MKIVRKKIKLEELKKMAERMYGNLVKAVVDVEKGIMVVSGELHSDEENLLLKKGSKQQNIWGINLYPDKYPSEDWIEFDSMINLRPSFNNFSRGVDDPKIRQKIVEIVNKLINE
jgi:hypothetical protein